MSLSVFHYRISAFILCRCRSFNPSLCRLSPFLLPSMGLCRCFKAMFWLSKKVAKTSD